MFNLSQRESLRVKVHETLQRLRPALQADGGDVEIVEITEDGRLRLKLLGTCGGCPMSSATLHQGIEKVIHRDVPEIQSVEAVEA